MRVIPCIGALVVLLNAGEHSAHADSAPIAGRIIDDTSCDDDGDRGCRGLRDATIVMWDASKPPPPPKRACQFKPSDLLWRGVSQKDGTFTSGAIDEKTQVAFDVCLGRHERYPHHEERKPSSTLSLIRLTPIPQNEAEARELAGRLHARAQRKAGAAKSPLVESYRGEWNRLEEISYPPEAKAMLALAFKNLGVPDALQVKGIELYATVDKNAMSTCRAMAKVAIKQKSPPPVCTGKLLGQLPDSITKDIFKDERKRFIWIDGEKDLKAMGPNKKQLINEM